MAWKDQPCIIWEGKIHPSGYGMGLTHFIHIETYVATHGPVPEGLEVCHHCDVKLCYEATHLWAGTHSDNMRDAVAKGRWRGPTGKTWKLSEEAIEHHQVAARRRVAADSDGYARRAAENARKGAPKIAAALRGKPKSEAHRAALSAAVKAAAVRRRHSGLDTAKT